MMKMPLKRKWASRKRSLILLNGTSARNVGKFSSTQINLFSIRNSTAKKSLMSAVYVGNCLATIPFSSCIRQLTLAQSLLSVMTVGEASVAKLYLVSTRKFTGEESLIHAIFVGRALSTKIHLLGI
jgi:hypothetical protein